MARKTSKKNKQKKILNVAFLLDMTGSMQAVEQTTISGFNEYLRTLKNEKDELNEVYFTLTLFNKFSIVTIYDNVPLADVKPLTTDIYKPNDLTPLYDAIGKTIKTTEARVGTGKAQVIFVIMTDGEENCSVEYKREDIFKLIQSKEKDEWTFAFLGANQDSWQTGQSIGFTNSAAVMDYAGGNEVHVFATVGMVTNNARRSYADSQVKGLFADVKDKDDNDKNDKYLSHQPLTSKTLTNKTIKTRPIGSN